MTPIERARAHQISIHHLEELIADQTQLMQNDINEARQSGLTMAEIATNLFVSRQTLHSWINK